MARSGSCIGHAIVGRGDLHDVSADDIRTDQPPRCRIMP